MAWDIGAFEYTSGGLTASATESAKIADTVTATLTPLQASPTEAAKGSDTVTPTLDPLQTGTLSEAANASESVSAALTLEATISEAAVGTETVEPSVATTRLQLTNVWTGTGSVSILSPYLVGPEDAQTDYVTNTTAGGTEIQITDTGGGDVYEWATPPLAAGVTLTGAVLFNVWALESNAAANVGGRARLYKVSNDYSTWTEMGGGPFDDGAEWPTTTPIAHRWIGRPTSNNVLSVGDRVGVRLYLTNVGTMASGHTGTVRLGSATGDTFLEFSEVLTFALASEAATLADTVTPTLTPLEATATESAKASESVSASLADLVVSVTESATVADTVATTLDPLATTATESAKAADTATPTLDPLATSVTDSAKVSDSVSPSLGDLVATLSESLVLDDIGQGAYALLGVLKISDTVQAERIDAGALSREVTAESATVADTATVTLDPLAATATESATAADQTPPSASIVGAGDLSREVTAEAVVLDDVGQGAIALLGAVKITDSVQAELTFSGLTVSVAEAAKASESGSIERTKDEHVAIGDGPPTPTLNPLIAATTADTLTLTDTVSAVLDLGALPAEAVTVTDGAPTTLTNPLQATPTEAAVVQDQVVFPGSTLHVDLAEGLVLSTTGAEVMSPLVTAPTADALVISDTLTVVLGVAASATESGVVSDTLTATMDRMASAAAAVVVSDETPQASLDPLIPSPPTDLSRAVTDETFRLSDGVIDTRLNPLAVVTAATLVASDTVTVIRVDPQVASLAKHTWRVDRAVSWVVDPLVEWEVDRMREWRS